jgi:DNA-directed RNA polymerase subunit RPC12/RpoP
MTRRTCPNCGAELPDLLAHARMVDCGYCGSSVVLDDAATRLAGKAGVMAEAPELIGIGHTVILGELGAFTATGHVRYDYGRGHWDEYHGALDDGDLVWVSVDEGDVALQRPVPRDRWPHLVGPPRLGREVVVDGIPYACSEVDNAVAKAFRGQLPEEIVLGETHLYANFSGPRGAILSAEFWGDGEAAWFRGVWIDPYMVERLV